MRDKVRRRKLATQILTSQLTILIFTVVLGFALVIHEEGRQLDREYQQRALAIAHTVAGLPAIRDAMASGDRAGIVQGLAGQVRRDSGGAYVVVIDAAGIRHSHPTPTLVGQRIEEPVVALDGQDHLSTDQGSLGPSANARVPLRSPTGQIIGEVSVGFLESTIAAEVWRESVLFGLFAALTLALGAAAAYLLARRLKRTTFGLELHEIASLLSEREAMLHGVREGVVTLDADDRVTLVNDEARRLLGLTGNVVGERLGDRIPDGRLREVLAGRPAGDPPGGDVGDGGQIVLTDDYCLEVNRMPVRLGDHNMAVVTLRDRTEVEGVLRELENMRGLIDALRAQGHEFSNRLHTLAGLLELGDVDEALRFIAETEGTQAMLLESVRERIGSPMVAGLFLAKTTVAAERGVDLVLADESLLEDAGGYGKVLLTVIGNLLDNAIDAAATGPVPGRVILDVRQDGDGVRLTVSDTGPGIPDDLTEEIFRDGFSTKQPRRGVHRGLGLALVRRVVQHLGGQITLTSGSNGGAAFTVTLPPVPTDAVEARLEPAVASR